MTQDRAVAWEVRGAELHRVLFDEEEARKLAAGFKGSVKPLYDRPAPMPVKGLEWERITTPEPNEHQYDIAKTPIGYYMIEADPLSYSPTTAYYVTGPDSYVSQHVDVPSAKAAAQADYEKRILSALDLSPAPQEGEEVAREQRWQEHLEQKRADYNSGEAPGYQPLKAAFDLSPATHQFTGNGPGVVGADNCQVCGRWSDEPETEICKDLPADCSVSAVFEFDRYVNGQLMAEGVTIERQKTLEGAMKAAARIASRGPHGEVPVLVLRASPCSKGAE